jgi:general secretion pathway protein C
VGASRIVRVSRAAGCSAEEMPKIRAIALACPGHNVCLPFATRNPSEGKSLQLSWHPKLARILIVLVTLGLCAFFLAQGITNLVALKLLPYKAQDSAAGASATLTELKGEAPPDALAILRRNIFDPLTGSLPKHEEPLVSEDDEDDEDDTETEEVFDENHLPGPCEGATRLVASMYSEKNPEWSFASLSLGTGSPLLYRVGGTVESRTLHTVYPEAVLLKGSNGQFCSLTMFKSPNAPPPKPATPPPAVAEAAAPAPGGAKDDELDKGIKMVSETKYSVQRSLVDKLLQNQGELMRSARVVPHEENGRVVGVKLYGIRKSSLFGKLGLQNGDMLRTINGFDMGSPDSALEAYAKLRSASNLSVALVRRGNAVTMDYNISN